MRDKTAEGNVSGARPAPVGVGDQGCPVAAAGLGQQVVDVGLDRRLADDEAAAISVLDSPSAISTSTSSSRAVSPSSGTGSGDRGRRARSSASSSRRWTDGSSCASPAATAMIARLDLLRTSIFGQEAAGSGLQRPEHPVVVGVGREHDDAWPRAARDDQLAGRLDAVVAGHVEVHQHDVGVERRRPAGRRRRRRRRCPRPRCRRAAPAASRARRGRPSGRRR